MLKGAAKWELWQVGGIIHRLGIATGTHLCVTVSLRCVACVWDPQNSTVPEFWTLNFLLLFLSRTHNINVTAFSVCFQFLCYFSRVFVLAACCSSGSPRSHVALMFRFVHCSTWPQQYSVASARPEIKAAVSDQDCSLHMKYQHFHLGVVVPFKGIVLWLPYAWSHKPAAYTLRRHCAVDATACKLCNMHRGCEAVWQLVC